MKDTFSNSKIKYNAYMYLTLGMSISGSAVVVSKMMVAKLPTYLAAELGIMVGMPILFLLTFFIKRESPILDLKTHGVLFAQAFFGVFLYRVFTNIGLSYTTAATGGLITSATPIIIALFAYYLLKEQLKPRQILGTVLAVIGLLIINLYSYFSLNTNDSSIKGNLLIFAAVICEALFSILSKVKCKTTSPLCRTTIIVGYAFLLLLPFSIRDAIAYDFRSLDIRTLLCITYYGVFVTFLSYIFWFRGIARLQAANAAVFTSVVPVSSIFLSALLLQEKVSIAHIISLCFILTGIIVSCREKGRFSYNKKPAFNKYNGVHSKPVNTQENEG